MIGTDQAAAESIVAAFRAASGVEALDKGKVDEFAELAISATSKLFPGALFAWPRSDKCTVYYAVAESSAQWRRLRPLLLAFVGPTLTSFQGWLEPLLHHIPTEAFLGSGNWYAVARLVPSDGPAAAQMARRSLQRMLRTVLNAPSTTQAATPSTSRLLSQFTAALNGNDRESAQRILDVCRTEYRVDALNLSFLRVQMLSHFGDWQAIVDSPEFPSLRHTRKPPRVASAMLEALYRVHLHPLTGADWQEKQSARWHDVVAALARPLLRLPIPVGISPGACRLYGWQALESDRRRIDLEFALAPYATELGELYDALKRAGRDSHSDVTDVPRDSQSPPIAAAQQALATAEDSDTLASFSDAIARLEALDESSRAELLHSQAFRRIFEAIRADSGSAGPMLHWPDWLDRLSDPRFTASFRVLQRAVSEWPAASLVDPMQIAQFARGVETIPEMPPASERLADALPLLAAWAADDPAFPRPAMAPAYEALLFRLTLSARRTNYDLDSAAILVRGLLGVGLSAPAYDGLLDDCLALAGEGLGKRTVYWLLDTLEETLLNPSPSPGKRIAFWHATHARLAPIFAHLSLGQRAALHTLAVSLGIAAPEAPQVDSASDGALRARIHTALADRTIGIYTLTESAGRQAAQAILDLAPSAKVSLSNDAVGSSTLKSLAQHCDIFVVATASAKHAATGFIQQARPREKPLLFAAGRGFTSIIRALEDFLLGRDE